MSSNVPGPSTIQPPNFQSIFNEALEEYKRKTGKDITTHPLAEEIKGCLSPDAILTVLEGKANELNQSQSSDERLTKRLTPTVNVLNALSTTLGQGVGTVSPSTFTRRIITVSEPERSHPVISPHPNHLFWDQYPSCGGLSCFLPLCRS
jgi:hypothetical protein